MPRMRGSLAGWPASHSWGREVRGTARHGPRLAGLPGPVFSAQTLLSRPSQACSRGCRLGVQSGGRIIKCVAGKGGCVGTGSPPSGGWIHGLGSQDIYLPDAWQHSHEVAIAVIVPMFRGGDRGPGLLPPPRVPPPTESVPCSCPFRGLAVGRGRSQNCQGPFSKLRGARCRSPGRCTSCPRAEGPAGATPAQATLDTPTARPCPWALQPQPLVVSAALLSGL